MLQSELDKLTKAIESQIGVLNGNIVDLQQQVHGLYSAKGAIETAAKHLITKEGGEA